MTAKKSSKRRTIIEEDIDDSLPPEPMLDPDEETLDDIVAQYGGSDIQFRVQRITPKGLEFLYSGAERIDPLWLQSRFPEGGEFEVTIIAPNGSSRKVRSLIGRTLPNPGIPGVPGFDVTKALFDRLDRMEQRQAVPAGSLLEQAQAMKILFDMRPQGGATEGLAQIVDAFKLGMSLKDEATGKSPGWMELIGDLAKQVLPVVMSARGIGSPVTTSPVNITPAAQVSEGALKQWENQIHEGIAFLKEKALNGSDPLLYVHVIADNAKNYVPIIRAALDKQFDDFAAIDPEIAQPQYQPFFRTIFDGLRQAFGPDDSMATDIGGSVGDVSDVGSDGAAGKGRRKPT